jgi:hypothetical protein
MSRVYDIEDFFDELDTYMKANLGTYITQMNTDKPDITLATPQAEAYYFQNLEDTDVPYSPFVWYGEIDTSTEAGGPEQIKSYTVQVGILLARSNKTATINGKTLLRYRECLERMFEKGWNKVNKRIKLGIVGISPFPYSLVNKKHTHDGIGVTLDLQIV